MKPLALSALAVASLVLLAGCSSGGSGKSPSAPTTPPRAPSATEPIAAKCADLVADPAWAAKMKAADGCVFGDSLQVASGWDCRDGSTLYTIQSWWGNSKGNLVEVPKGTTVADDPAYGPAYKRCTQ